MTTDAKKTKRLTKETVTVNNWWSGLLEVDDSGNINSYKVVGLRDYDEEDGIPAEKYLVWTYYFVLLYRKLVVR